MAVISQQRAVTPIKHEALRQDLTCTFQALQRLQITNVKIFCYCLFVTSVIKNLSAAML